MANYITSLTVSVDFFDSISQVYLHPWCIHPHHRVPIINGYPCGDHEEVHQSSLLHLLLQKSVHIATLDSNHTGVHRYCSVLWHLWVFGPEIGISEETKGRIGHLYSCMDSIIYDFLRILSNHYACIYYMWCLNCQSVHSLSLYIYTTITHDIVAFELSICALSLVSTCSCACCSTMAIYVSQNSNEEVDLPKIKHVAKDDDVPV